MAKTKKTKAVEKVETPPAPKRRRRKPPSIVKRARRHRVHREALAANPPPLTDLVEFILPGFVGYGATRLVSRIAYVQLSPRFPNAAKHLSVGTSVLTAVAAWLLVHRVKRIEKYHTPVVVGSSIAALQAILQCYLPKFGWMVSDYLSGPMAATPAVAAVSTPAQVASAAASSTSLNDTLDEDDFGVLSIPTISDPDEDLDETAPDSFDN